VKTNEVKVKWVCERKSIDYGVEAEDRCGEEFETVETLLEWQGRVANVFCPSCGAHLTQTADVAIVMERGRGKIEKDDIPPIEEEEDKPTPVVDEYGKFKGFGYS